jgi:hypothetical protein
MNDIQKWAQKLLDNPCKYPHVSVKLAGEDGNAIAILSRVYKAMKRAGISRDKTDAFLKEAMSSDYDNMLRVCMKWVDVQ